MSPSGTKLDSLVLYLKAVSLEGDFCFDLFCIALVKAETSHVGSF